MVAGPQSPSPGHQVFTLVVGRDTPAPASTPWLGFFISTDSSKVQSQYSLGTAQGVHVDYIEPHSPSAHVGVRAGEVISSVNGSPVTTVAQLENALAHSQVGATVSLTLVTLKDQTHLVPDTCQSPN